jgi:hypothetical protein
MRLSQSDYIPHAHIGQHIMAHLVKEDFGVNHGLLAHHIALSRADYTTWPNGIIPYYAGTQFTYPDFTNFHVGNRFHSP